MSREYYVIDPTTYRDLTTKKSSHNVEIQTESTDDKHTLQNILSPLNPKIFNGACSLMKMIIDTKRFIYLPLTGEIIVDNVFIMNSNLIDLLHYILYHKPLPNVNLTGLNQFIALIADTAVPSFLIQNEEARTLFVSMKQS